MHADGQRGHKERSSKEELGYGKGFGRAVLIASRIANWSAGVEPLKLPGDESAPAAYLLKPDAAPPTGQLEQPFPRPPRPPASWAAWPWPSNRPGPTSASCGCRSPSIWVAGGRSGRRCSAGTTSD